MELILDTVGAEVISMVALALAGLLTTALINAFWKVGQYFGVKRDNENLVKEEEWRVVMNQTFARIAALAVKQGRNVSSRDIVAEAFDSIPDTIKGLTKAKNPTVSAIVSNTTLQDIASEYLQDALKAKAQNKL